MLVRAGRKADVDDVALPVVFVVALSELRVEVEASRRGIHFHLTCPNIERWLQNCDGRHSAGLKPQSTRVALRVKRVQEGKSPGTPLGQASVL